MVSVFKVCMNVKCIKNVNLIYSGHARSLALSIS